MVYIIKNVTTIEPLSDSKLKPECQMVYIGKMTTIEPLSGFNFDF